MASTADNSTALQVMKDANADFLAFINNLRAFLTGQDPVTFDIGTGITVNSMLKLIDDYRNGKFNEIVLGTPSSGKYIKLSVSADGKLYISDANGNLAYVQCEKISSALIENSTAYNVTAENARIISVNGKVAVSGGNVKMSSLNIGTLKTSTLTAQNMNVNSMVVNSALQCDGILSYGTRKFAPKNVRKMFWRDNAPLNDAASYLVLENYNSEYKLWKMDEANNLKPEDLGFGTALFLPTTPDMVEICGENAYNDFHTGLLFTRAPTKRPYNVITMVPYGTSNNSLTTVYMKSPDYEFAALLAWATAKRDTMSSLGGVLFLTGFSMTDAGKEIYYKTGAHYWKVYRIMRITYSDTNPNQPVDVVFDGLTKIPAYSCIRFVLGVHDSRVETPTQTTRTLTFSLELG